MFFAGASQAFAIAVPDAIAPTTKSSSAPTTPADLSAMACIVIKLSLSFIPYLVVIAVGAFLQGLVKYIRHGDNEEKRTEGIKMMIYGTLGFFFMVSIWSILKLSAGSFGMSLLIPQFKASKSFTCS